LAAAFPFQGSAAVSLNWNRFEPAVFWPRPSAGASRAGRFAGSLFMKTIRPDNTDPIPLRRSPHRMGTIMLRFAGLLFLAMVVLALAWNR
jgi:hypothetical protein